MKMSFSLRRAIACCFLVMVGGGTKTTALASTPETVEFSKFSGEVSPFENAATPDAPGSNGPSLDALEYEFFGPKKSGTSGLSSMPGAGGQVLPAGVGMSVNPGSIRKSKPNLMQSFEGVNARDSRSAFDGNQYSAEPSDQGLCAGNGYILHSVNSALQIFDADSGTPLTKVLALNEFYGFYPSINRSDFTFGPYTFDISCHHDPSSDRWFHLAVDLEQDFESGDTTGRNYLDLAVSKTGDPTGKWDIYRIPAMNDGTEGTPDHGCAGGPCFGDFPHFAVNDDGLFITTNEFPFVGGYNGAQVYAISKQALLDGQDSITAYLFNTAVNPWMTLNGNPGFTVWPAKSAGRQSEQKAGGTQYFVSSDAVFDDSLGQSSRIHVWALTNTKSLNDADAGHTLELQTYALASQQYAIPPSSLQKDGPIPLGETQYGATEPGLIDCSDSRVSDVRFANNKLWAVLNTAAEVNGEQVAGVAWFILRVDHAVRSQRSVITPKVIKQGILALESESLAYPALAVTTSGKGVITFSCVGPNRYPSACFAPMDAIAGTGDVVVAADGQAPHDGFTVYSSRPRWGDYSAAAVDGTQAYLVSNYIESSCTVSEFLDDQSCGESRVATSNWSSRITKVTQVQGP